MSDQQKLNVGKWDARRDSEVEAAQEAQALRKLNPYKWGIRRDSRVETAQEAQAPQTMKVSIIITTYNQPGTLSWTIQSALRQTYSNTEIIIVDGGSTDELAAHCARICAAVRFIEEPNGETLVFYNDDEETFSKITAIRTENRGISDARNTGAKRSTGKALVFLDDDNWIEPTFVEKTIALMAPGVGIVATDMHVFSENSDSLCETKIVSPKELMESNSIPVTSLVRAEAFKEANGFKENVYEDWELWINILKLGWEGAIVKEPLFHYRCRPNSLITRHKERHDERIENMKRLHADVL